MTWESAGVVGAAVASLVGLSFVVYEIRMSRATSEVNLNLEVMIRLDEVLLRIATDSDAHSAIWSVEGCIAPDNGTNHVLLVSLIDAVEVALMACRRVPGFARNAEDWKAYAEYCLDYSKPLREEVEANEVFWPYFTDLRKTVARRREAEGRGWGPTD